MKKNIIDGRDYDHKKIIIVANGIEIESISSIDQKDIKDINGNV